MKIAIAIACALLSANAMAETQVIENDVGLYLPKCAKPMTSVAVGKFTCKAQSCNKAPVDSRLAGIMTIAQMAGEGPVVMDFSKIGDGMSNAITTALKATNCFDVQEREAMDELKKELDIAGIKMEVKPADFMILGAITSVDVATQKSSFGGGLIPIVGSIRSSTTKANLAMDIRIVNIKQANVRDSKSFDANSETSAWGIAGAGVIGGGGLFGGYSMSKSPEMDRIATETVVRATHFLVDALAKDHVVSRPALVAKKTKEAPKASDTTTSGHDFGFGL